MKVLTVMNRKGGVGKTTLARYISEYLARYKNLRVLTIDLDNQCNLSSLLLKMDAVEGRVMPPIHPDYDPSDTTWSGRCSSASTIWDGSMATYDVMYPKPIPNWEILPGDSKQLFDLEHDEDPRIKLHLRNLLGELLSEVAGDYDAVVVDTGPSQSTLLESALHAATHVLIPFAAEPQSINGIGQMLSLFSKAKHARSIRAPELKLIGLAVNMYRPALRSQARIIESMATHPKYGPMLIPHFIKNRAIFPELDAKNPIPTSVFDITKREHLEIKEDMEMLCEFVARSLLDDAAAGAKP